MNKLMSPLLELSRPTKRFLVVVLDLLLSLIAVWIAFYLRIDQAGLPQMQQKYVYLLAPLLAFPLFVRFGLYRAIFRYTGMAALATTAKAVGLYGALFFMAIILFKWDGVPRSVGLIQPILFLLLVSTSRAMARFWLAGQSGKSYHGMGRLLIYGAGQAGAQTASALSAASIMNRFRDTIRNCRSSPRIWRHPCSASRPNHTSRRTKGPGRLRK